MRKGEKYHRKDMEETLRDMPKSEVINIALDYREGYFDMVKKHEKYVKKMEKKNGTKPSLQAH